MTKLYNYLIPALLILINANVYSQTTYVHRTGSPNSDFGLTCYPTRDSGLVVGQEGSTNGMDIYSALVKLDANGIMQWNKKYQIGQYTIPYTVLQAKDEGFIVYAMCSDSAVLNYNHYFIGLYKTDNTGNTQWNKQYSLSVSDMPLNMVYRNAGGYITFSVGDYNQGSSPKTVVTVFDDYGNINWTKHYSALYGLKGVKGIEMPDSNICFIATSADPNNNFFLDVIVTMLDQNGNVLWSKNLGTYYDDEPYALAANSSNEVFVTGREYFINRNWDSFLYRLDKFGNVITSKVYDGGTSDGEIMRCILAYNDGSCKLLGDMGTFDERDITLINVDSNASVTSSYRYAFSPLFTNYPYDFHNTLDGGLIFTGDYRPPTTDRDAVIVKTEFNGRIPCFMLNAPMTEYNEAFHDSAFSITTPAFTITPHNYPDSIPLNALGQHVVCALALEVEEQSSVIDEVYPNPVTDFLSVNFKDIEGIFAIQLFSAEGKIVYSAHTDELKSKFDIDLRNFAAGMYFLSIRTSNSLFGKKIIKE